MADKGAQFARFQSIKTYRICRGQPFTGAEVVILTLAEPERIYYFLPEDAHRLARALDVALGDLSHPDRN